MKPDNALQRARHYFATGGDPTTRDALAQRLGVHRQFAGRVLCILRHEGAVQMQRKLRAPAVYSGVRA